MRFFLTSAAPLRRILLLPTLAGALWLSGCQSKEPVATEDQLPDTTKVRTLTPDEQIRDLTTAIKEQPGNVALFQRRARIYLTLNNGPAALADAERVVALEGSTPTSFLLRAQALRAVGKVKEALADCTQAQQLGYDGSDLPLLQGELSYIVRRYPDAIKYLNEALRKSQFEERAYFYKGMIYAETGDTAHAISNLQTASEQAPQFTDSFGQLAGIYNAKRDFKIARQYLDAGLRANPDDGFLHYNLGVNALLQKFPDSALTFFTRAAQLDTTLYLAHFNAAVLHYDRDEFAPAVKHLKAVLRRTSQPPAQTRLLLADSYDRLGAYRAAVGEYQKLVKEAPADTRLARRLQAATALLRQQQGDSAAGRTRPTIRPDSLRKIR